MHNVLHAAWCHASMAAAGVARLATQHAHTCSTGEHAGAFLQLARAAFLQQHAGDRQGQPPHPRQPPRHGRRRRYGDGWSRCCCCCCRCCRGRRRARIVWLLLLAMLIRFPACCKKGQRQGESACLALAGGWRQAAGGRRRRLLLPPAPAPTLPPCPPTLPHPLSAAHPGRPAAGRGRKPPRQAPESRSASGWCRSTPACHTEC